MKCTSAIALFFAVIMSAIAQTNPATRTMSLQDCFTEALQHNFAVQIEYYGPQISLYNLYSAYGGYDPAFSISGQHDVNVSPGGFTPEQIPLPATTSKSDVFSSGLGGALPSGLIYNFSGSIADRNFNQFTNHSESSGGSIGVTLTQPLLKNFWIDGNRLTISIARNRLKYSEQGLRSLIINTITSVENAYYDLIFAKGDVQVQEEALVLSQKQLSDDEQRVQVGSLAPLDVQQDKSQVAQDQANLIAARFRFVSAQNILKNLLTDNYSAWHDQDIEPITPLNATRQFFDLQESWNRGMTQRPDLIQAKLDVEQQGIQLKYSFNQLFPELDLTGSYGFNGEGREFSGVFSQVDQGNAPFYSYGAQLSIPLGNVKARNNYKAGKANKEQLLLALKQLEQAIMVSIDNAVKQSESTWENVQATHEARIYAEAALDAEQKKYNVGKSTTFTVLQLQIKLTQARSAEIGSVVNYHKALALLAHEEGNTLETHQIDFKVK